jgi:tripartite-type tricarboxylate transporter receptor subunit TctC
MTHRRQLVFALGAGAALAPLHLLAQPAAAYPTKPVRIVVAAAPGSGDDITTRIVAAKLAELLGQQFVVENRPGAGGMIGQTLVAKSPPDGYTLLLAGGSMAGSHLVNANMGYDLHRDFTPVSLIETGPWSFVASPTLPIRTVQEFIAYARARPGKLNYGTIGVGQLPYWSVRLFNSMAGIDAAEVTYKSGGDAILDLIAGRLDYYFPPLPNAITSKDKLRILAVTSRVRSALLPDVPTLAESGLPDYEMPVWRSLMAPAGVRREIVDVLNAAMVKALASPDVREKIASTGTVATSSTPDEVRKRYLEQTAVFTKLAKEAGLKPQ